MSQVRLFLFFALACVSLGYAAKISTVAGRGDGDGRSADSVRFNGPYSIAFDAQGNLFVADFSSREPSGRNS